MKVEYLFSSPRGGLPLGKEELSLPLKTSPSEDHPFLTLGDYFAAVESFLLRDRAREFFNLLGEDLGIEGRIEHLDRLIIQSEKQGALCLVSRIRAHAGELSREYALNTAVGARARKWLQKEFQILHRLKATFRLPYLPEARLMAEVSTQTGSGEKAVMSMLLSNWFAGFREWHLSLDTDKRLRVRLWDQEGKGGFLDDRQSREMFREIAEILTLYYDTDDFRQVYPWHHAAGDFIVKPGEPPEVRLTTVRGYEPLMSFPGRGNDPGIAVVYFLLHLTIRMRLDRLDGIGESVWAGAFSLEAAFQGFFRALSRMEAEGRFQPGMARELLVLLKSFDKAELRLLFGPLFDIYQGEDPEDFELIRSHLEEHIADLEKTLQSYPSG